MLGMTNIFILEFQFYYLRSPYVWEHTEWQWCEMRVCFFLGAFKR